MSAALQLPTVWGTGVMSAQWNVLKRNQPGSETQQDSENSEDQEGSQHANLAFYRKHTEKMLRRYLYCSMQVGRAPSILADSVGRGWVSSRPVRTFEDAVIFVLDIEKCINQLSPLDRRMLSRIVLQEYTQTEAAALLGMSVRSIGYKFPQALDRLTRKLLDSGLLILPH